MLDFLDEKFKNEKSTKTFRRIDADHNLDIYVGYNEDKSPTIIIKEEGDIYNIESSRSISVKLYKQSDGKLSISFSLLDTNLYSLYLQFCNDIIESTRRIKKRDGLKFIIDRWSLWRLMFKGGNPSLLNENQIRGLIAELEFLKNYMIPQFGEEAAVSSWMGPEGAHKDFEINDTWFEVKSVTSSALTIKISSIEQLDSELIGSLVVTTLDRTNSKFHENISINEYIKDLKNSIKDYKAQLNFTSKLIKVGYYFHEEYDNYNYKILSRKMYIVNEDFPKVKKDVLGMSIVKISYEILISSIESYLEGECSI